ncbi:MAG: Glutamine transporter, periplasmic glutamine-binding protein [Ilumatobacteraceae bacterium]|nr:Glutamine transporter, periplasmic glutamine-binding protein [Ilumatobacteraceae bacterium]
MPSLRKHPLVALGFAGALLFGTAACGSSDSGSDGAKGSDGGSGEEATVWKVCSDMPYEPFEFEGEGPRGLKYTGFDIELLDAIAEDQGTTLDITDSDFDTIFASVNAGTCDIVASAVTITPERKENSLFSEPYFDADQSLLVPTDSDVTSLDDLAGKTIGVQTGTTGETYANENKPDGATVQAFPDASALFAALQADTIQAVLQDLPVNSDRATKDDKVTVVETFKTGEQYGFVVAKDNKDLQTKLDAGLKAVTDDGTKDDIYESYFPNAGN